MLGAIFSFLLFLLISFDWNLIKKYFRYLKTKDTSNFNSKELLIFCLINFCVVWVVVFTLLCTLVDRRVMHSEDNACVALFASLTFVLIVIYSYHKHLSLPSFIKYIKQKIHSPNIIPNKTNDVVKFNYFYAFKYIPQTLDAYNEGKSSIMAILDFHNIISQYPEFSKIAPKVKFGITDNKENTDIKVLTISIPNNQSISEVGTAYIVYNEAKNNAVYFTLEKSIDGYAIARPTSQGLHQLIDFVDSPQHFVERVFPMAIDELSKLSKTKLILDNQPKESITIKSVTPLLEFYSRFVKLKIGSFKNVDTGEDFKLCLFIDKFGDITKVSFSTTVGELDAEHIRQQKENLQILELSNGKFIITRKGSVAENVLFNPEYVNKIIDKLSSEVDNFFKTCSLRLTLPAYTHREVMLFVCSVILGSDNINKLKNQKGNLFLEKIYNLFVGTETPRKIIDCMQGMSSPCVFADSMHITEKLSYFLVNCTSVSFEERTWNGEKIRMLNLFESINFYTLVHLSDELKDITLQDIFDRKDELYINETCDRTAPAAVCTPIEQWPILETINRAEPNYIRFINKFIVERIEAYYSVYSALESDDSYLKLAKAILTEPFNVVSNEVFSYNSEYDYPPLDQNELGVFKETIDRLILSTRLNTRYIKLME